eukprot:1978122-Amphidinium_carterae.1
MLENRRKQDKKDQILQFSLFEGLAKGTPPPPPPPPTRPRHCEGVEHIHVLISGSVNMCFLESARPIAGTAASRGNQHLAFSLNLCVEMSLDDIPHFQNDFGAARKDLVHVKCFVVTVCNSRNDDCSRSPSQGCHRTRLNPFAKLVHVFPSALHSKRCHVLIQNIVALPA